MLDMYSSSIVSSIGDSYVMYAFMPSAMLIPNRSLENIRDAHCPLKRSSKQQKQMFLRVKWHATTQQSLAALSASALSAQQTPLD